MDDTHVALLFLDLDRFKLVNDTLGHTHGDELLIAVARRLNEHVRPGDLVTRIGGDEFMVVLGHVVSVSQALDLANRLRFSLRAPFMVNGMEFYVSASIGLAFASGDDPNANAEVLVRDADTAMYQAKDAGRDAVAVFDESMRTKVSERVELEHDLRRAVELRQLHLVYQPIVRIPHGPIEGRRGARALGPPHPGRDPARQVHPPGRGERADHGDRGVGARGGPAPARRVAPPDRQGSRTCTWRSTCRGPSCTTSGS